MVRVMIEDGSLVDFDEAFDFTIDDDGALYLRNLSGDITIVIHLDRWIYAQIIEEE